MIVPQEYRLKNTIKYPTTVIVGGISRLGLELAQLLIEQGGYVVIVDTVTAESIQKLQRFHKNDLISYLDYSAIPHLEEDIRRLDYVFYFNHDSVDFKSEVSTQEFLTFSNYLDATLSLASKFEAKFLLTTSIKANQMLLMENDMGMNFGKSSVSTPTYTDMELQKYAEGLVLEYEKKVNLDARVIRLGEIIGDGMDFKNNTAFVRLILNAAQNEMLELRKEGLENEWFIHMQDAAYALVKAEFGKGTKGKIYSAAYDSPYRHLSIAYKIQEISPGQLEIRFVEEKDNLPAIKLYKAAPNLSDIGWMPRVSFDKAVKQSLASAKIYIAEHSLKSLKNKNIQSNSPKSFKSKLRSFLNIAENESDESQFQTEGDLISNLIAEKQGNDELKKSRLLLANNELKARRRRPRTFTEKIQDYFWKTFIFFARFITILSNKSPLELGIILFSISLFIFFYFTLLSPAIYIGRNLINAKSNYDSIIENLENKNYIEVTKSAEKLNDSFENIQNITSKYKVVAEFLTLDNEFAQGQRLLDNYIIISSGVEDVGKSLEPLTNYTNTYQNNTEVRTGTETYLSIKDSGYDYQAYLDNLETNSVYLQIGLDKVNKGLEGLGLIDYTKFPSFINSEIFEFNTELKNSLSEVESLQIESNLSTFLGSRNPKSHLVLLLDNTRQTPIGGEIAAFGLVTLQKGSIANTIVQSIDQLEFDKTLISDLDLTEINNTRFTYVDRNNLQLQDISTINSFDSFSEVARKIWENQFNVEIDGVILMNLNALEQMNEFAIDKGQTVEIAGARFDNNFLASLNSTQVTNANLQTKRRIMAQLLAYNLDNIFNSFNSNLKEISNIVGNAVSTQDILINFETSDLQDLVKNSKTSLAEIENATSYIKVGVKMDDINQVNNDAYPYVTLTLKTSIDNTSKLINTLQIDLISSLGASREVSVCFPLDVTLSSIRLVETNIPSNRLTVNSNSFERCAVVKVLSESLITLSWSEDAIINSAQSAEFTHGIAKVNGATTDLDYSFSISNGLSINQIIPPTSFNPTNFSFRTKLFTNRLIQVGLAKSTIAQ